MNEVDSKLVELVTRLYNESGVIVSPTYPRILIRVLPREQETKSGIIIPDHKQNKPTLEGIVLSTFKPFFKSIISDATDAGDIQAGQMELLSPSVCIGDHVLFPHIAAGIIPVWPLDGGKGDYRLVPDDLILSKLDYSKQPVSDWLHDLAAQHLNGYELAEEILKHADIIRRDVAALTVSGA